MAGCIVIRHDAVLDRCTRVGTWVDRVVTTAIVDRHLVDQELRVIAREPEYVIVGVDGLAVRIPERGVNELEALGRRNGVAEADGAARHVDEPAIADANEPGRCIRATDRAVEVAEDRIIDDDAVAFACTVGGTNAGAGLAAAARTIEHHADEREVVRDVEDGPAVFRENVRKHR